MEYFKVIGIVVGIIASTEIASTEIMEIMRM